MNLDDVEVGEYVRTKKGFIGKLINIDTKNEAYYLDCGKCVSLVNIIKHSHNIIDLIEVGDYVNGMLVRNIDDENNLLVPDKDGYYNELRVKDIKSIVTKEQFENVSYKLEE